MVQPLKFGKLDMWFTPKILCEYLPMLTLKLIYVSKRGSWLHGNSFRNKSRSDENICEISWIILKMDSDPRNNIQNKQCHEKRKFGSFYGIIAKEMFNIFFFNHQHFVLQMPVWGFSIRMGPTGRKSLSMMCLLCHIGKIRQRNIIIIWII